MSTQEEWRKKVVVDSLEFKAHVSTVHPSQSDKLSGILKDPPKKKSLRMLRAVKLPSGKRVPFTDPPVNMFMGSMYETPADFTATLKPDDPETYLGKDNDGNPVDFTKYIHP